MEVFEGGSNPSSGALIATSNDADVNEWGIAPFDTNPAFRAFDFSSSQFSIIENETYWFVIRATSSISGTNCGTGSRLRSYVTIENNHSLTDSYYSRDGGATWILDYGFTVEAPLRIEGVVEPDIVISFPLDQDLGVGGFEFGDAWTVGSKCDGAWKLHTGVDYVASSSGPDNVYAVADGFVKFIDNSPPWGSYVILEHELPSTQKYTTVYWHVDPVVEVGDPVFELDQIATIGTLTSGDHLHFGIRMGEYEFNKSGYGALPVTAGCDYPGFSDGFINPEDPALVRFK